MATITLVVTYTESADVGVEPAVSTITVEGNALTIGAASELERRKAWFAAKEIQKRVVSLGLLPAGASPDKIIDP